MTSFAHVASATIPFAGKPYAIWKSMTALRVAVPKMASDGVE
jgi:hypothetical protein